MGVGHRIFNRIKLTLHKDNNYKSYELTMNNLREIKGIMFKGLGLRYRKMKKNNIFKALESLNVLF